MTRFRGNDVKAARQELSSLLVSSHVYESITRSADELLIVRLRKMLERHAQRAIDEYISLVPSSGIPRIDLGETSIRLVKLLPGSGNRRITIQLVDSHISGSNQVPYDALSYTWGDGSRNKTIACHGRRLLVTKTLFEALHRFRDADHNTTLWIDQICICQERTRERNQQVQMMGDIFRGARKVIVWLGDEYDDSRAGMQLAKQLLAIARLQPEVVLNPRVDIVLGSSMITWDELDSIVALLDGPMPVVWNVDQAISAFELPFSKINRIRLRHMRRTIRKQRSLPSANQSESWNAIAQPEKWEDEDEENDPELLDLLLMSRGLGATDPRDKIYALLGLGKHDIEADYSSEPETVFCDFALRTIGLVSASVDHDEHLNLTSHEQKHYIRRAMVLLSCAGRQNQRLSLPSWVPDWTVNLASRPLIFGIEGQCYGAGGAKLGLFDWSPDFGLQLDGILIDTIQAAGSVRLGLDVHGQSPVNTSQLIEQWWLEAGQIAYVRIARSPGSTNYTDAFEAMRRRLYLCKHGHYVGETRQKRRSTLLEEIDPSADDSCHSASQTMTLGPTHGRVMFASSTGYLGLAPHGSREGDVVFVVRGADVPFVLRPQSDGAYELIGEAYVQGIMDGEALGGGIGMAQDVMIR
nr:heterokaryon incompatibility protein 6, or allele [Quercus suber]